MRKTAISGAVSIVAGLSAGTKLAELRALTGADKVGRHDAIVGIVATIAALALCNSAAPKGLGNPADHSKVAAVFTEAKMPRYAEACMGFSAALKAKGFRSVTEWEDALAEGLAMADAMFADLRPKVYTKAELAAREAKRAEKAKAREADEKAETAKAEETAKQALIAAEAKAYERGVSEATKAEAIIALIKTGQFKAEEVAAIMAACQSVTETAAA